MTVGEISKQIAELKERLITLHNLRYELIRHNAIKNALLPGHPVHKDKYGRTYPHVSCDNCGAVTVKPPYFGGDSGNYCAKKKCLKVMSSKSWRDWGEINPVMVEDM